MNNAPYRVHQLTFLSLLLMLMAACSPKTAEQTGNKNFTQRDAPDTLHIQHPLKLIPAVFDSAEPPLKDTFSTVSVGVVGDLMVHQTQLNKAYTDSGYNFAPGFELVKDYLQQPDIMVGNLETVCAGSGHPYKGYPVFNTPDTFVTTLKDAGFDMLITANNHATDMGDAGLLRTIDVIKQNNLHYVGTYTDAADRDSVRIITKESISIGFLAYTYGSNNRLPQHSYMMNVIDSALIAADVQRARKQGADIVLVYLHYGAENSREPGDDQRETVQQCIAAGADLIIGCHTHVVSPVDWQKADSTAMLDSAFIAYNLGNFISNQYWRYTDAGVLLNIELEKNHLTDSLYVKGVNYLPTWVYRARNTERPHHTIIPAQWALNDTLPPYIHATQQAKMKEAYNDTRDIITRYTHRIKPLEPKPWMPPSP